MKLANDDCNGNHLSLLLFYKVANRICWRAKKNSFHKTFIISMNRLDLSQVQFTCTCSLRCGVYLSFAPREHNAFANVEETEFLWFVSLRRVCEKCHLLNFLDSFRLHCTFAIHAWKVTNNSIKMKLHPALHSASAYDCKIATY